MPDRKREDEEESGGFKVTDRRLFTPEGERRPDAETAPPKTEVPPAQQPPAGTPASPAKPDSPPAEPHPEHQGPVSFEHLVMSLATTAMFQLGLVANSTDETPRVDLIAAKETIDLLDILKQKTQGNLTPQEEGLLTGSLYELRMVFVELSGKTGRVL